MPEKDLFKQSFRLGPWEVLPDRGVLRGETEEKHVEPKVMDVLLALARQQGEVVSKDRLVEVVWAGRAVGDDVITRAISELRRALGDNARSPEYVQNIPRRGYRLLKAVVRMEKELKAMPAEAPPEEARVTPRPAYYLPLLAGFFAIALIALIAWMVWPRADNVTSIAVFPLECAPEDEILCYSFAEELVSKLLQKGDAGERIKVVRSRTPYSADAAISIIANGVFTGQLMRAGDRIYISAEILNRPDGFTIWTSSYDGVVGDAVKIRARLANDVVAELLGERANQLVADSEPTSFEALDAYTRGQYQLSIRSAQSIHAAIAEFEKTIELDPNFGPGYVSLGYANALLPEYDPSVPKDRYYARALQYADEGVNVDPSVYGSARTIHGFIDHKHGLWARSGAAHEEAISAPTVYPISHQLYSHMLATVGRLEEALIEAQKAREIDPQQAVLISRVAIAYFWLDDIANAERYFDLSESHAEYAAPIHDLAYSLFLIRKGDYDAAARHAMAGLEKYGINADWVPPVFEGMHNPDKYAAAHATVASLSDAGLLTPTVEITLWVLLKDADRAMKIARMLEGDAEAFPAEAIFIPQFSVLREHPDFPALLDAFGLTQYWNGIGCRWENDRVSCGARPQPGR